MRNCYRWMHEEKIDRWANRTQLNALLPVMTGNCAHGSDGSCSHITNHSTMDSVCYTSFGVHSYHSTPFAAEWNVHKASIASFTLD
ncbi:hypothetical protein TNCV_546421 [Trichonephila clavipes]|nr:hypothetical protein TNCV_546421 [Trichonephila clavipes]